MKLAPIILFAYNRPYHTEQTLLALHENQLADKSTLYIYCDGPKEDASEEELKKIRAVRDLARKKLWCREVIIVEQQENKGLASAVIAGISEVIEKHGTIIVLEDDLVTAPYFLTYCNEGLELYENHKQVYAINGYQFPIGIDEITAFLSPLATSSWGWATWKDRWAVFEKNPAETETIASNVHLSRRFNFADYPYVPMLKNKNSWAIRWYYSVFLHNGLGVFPTQSLVKNIGFDGSGEHGESVDFQQELCQSKIPLTVQEKIHLQYYARKLDFFTKKNELSKKQPKTSLPKVLQNLVRKLKNG